MSSTYLLPKSERALQKPSWFEKHHKALFVSIGASIMIIGVVCLILWLMGIEPFTKYRPITNINTDERVLLHLFNKRRAAENLPPVKKLPESRFDPNGFHGAWAAPPLEIDDPQVYQDMCTPCWLPDSEDDLYTGSFQHGMTTVPKQTIIDQCRHKQNKGNAAYKVLLSKMGEDKALEVCWNSVCLPSKVDKESSTAGCKANYFTKKNGQIVGQGWGTLGGSKWRASMESTDKNSLIQKLCPGKSGQTAPKQTTIQVGDVQVPKIYGASKFMQTAFNDCFVKASGKGVENPTSLCTNIVLQNAPKASTMSLSAAQADAQTWYDTWSANWKKLVAQRQAQAKKQVYCDQNGNDATSSCCPTTLTKDKSKLPEGCCMIPSPKLSDGSYVAPPGGCVRLCAAPWAP